MVCGLCCELCAIRVRPTSHGRALRPNCVVCDIGLFYLCRAVLSIDLYKGSFYQYCEWKTSPLIPSSGPFRCLRSSRELVLCTRVPRSVR